jgi:hypothetical protein
MRVPAISEPAVAPIQLITSRRVRPVGLERFSSLSLFIFGSFRIHRESDFFSLAEAILDWLRRIE